MPKESFVVKASPGTDIWRKPLKESTTDRFNAPFHPLVSAPVSLSAFESARVTFEASWTTQYDQGGLLLYLSKESDASFPGKSPEKWVKTGIEWYQGQPYLASVATLTYSDWSLCPPGVSSDKPTTIEVRREGDELGSSLWIYELTLDDQGQVRQRAPLREVCWFFAEEKGWYLNIAAMAARPAKSEAVIGGEKDLEVKFTDIHVHTSRNA